MKNFKFNLFDTSHPKLSPAKGRILIAEPFLQGPYFGRSIVFLTEYGKDGAVGFVLNKSSELYPDEVIDDLYSFKGELFLGGPVSSNTLHFIHTLGDQVPGSMKVTDTIYWGGDFETVKELINEGKADNQSVKFFAGYSGWSPGQLEEEIAENSWIVASVPDEVILSYDLENIWKKTMESMGDVYKTWSNFPQNPTFN
ncbi:YqgE/AlgH family protein [Marinilabiliaceae bacterium JC017]|nr:YqgE/AlgH family protein [Marinilabiliaceae bacterium JC017]